MKQVRSHYDQTYNEEIRIRHYLYDCSLPVEERAPNKILVPSAGAAARYLGVEDARVFNNRRKKHRIWSPIYNKWFAIRIAPHE